MQRPKLRDNKQKKIYELYPIGNMPDTIICEIGKWMVYNFAIGKHGSQFTIVYDIPSSSKKFTVKRPPILDFSETMNQIGFNNSWISILE